MERGFGNAGVYRDGRRNLAGSSSRLLLIAALFTPSRSFFADVRLPVVLDASHKVWIWWIWELVDLGTSNVCLAEWSFGPT